MSTRREHGAPPARAAAIHYDGAGAPRVTAKGEGEIAQAIVAIAREHDVALHSDPSLARLLSGVPLGEEIPQALYVAVAQILVFAYEVSGKPIPARG